ncbi:MAG: penicillin acylase family protein [Candidatus Rokubacteria bacterium]|nr:penicillin acylase family protein [Candidatus Rokubacteria bacterium]
MSASLTRRDLENALPDVSSSLKLAGLKGGVDIWRDAQGIPHVKAESTHDAFLAQGFVHAQDRLWQMAYDRRRAYGRWAECAGRDALAQDVQMRRFRLEVSSRADYDAASAETKAMLDAYAAGVNAFIATTKALPVEFRLAGVQAEPWRPWDSSAVYKVRHVLMGLWQTKAWRARLVRHLGAARAAELCPGTQPNPMLIVPPGVEWTGPPANGIAELTEAEAALAFLPEWENGSNNWAVAGRRTASGKPLVAGDPHRPLDVPNVYYQNHVACPEFDVIGLSFAGVPGFPHFGHNRSVAWCVTHTSADYQDLYIERFQPGDPGRYEFKGEWREARTTRETIRVRGEDAVEIEVTETHHGPVVLGDPRSGYAMSFRYTATAEPNRTFEALLPMLRASTAAEIEAAMRPWVDPVNNFVFADVHGAIGYKTRGQVPVRSRANAWVPVPGWDGAHEWQGMVPFEEMPVVRDPETGWVATANSKVVGPDYPHYISLDFAPDFRTRRLVHHLSALEHATVDDMAAIHADRVSIPARELVDILRYLSPAEPRAKAAVDLLRGWDGTMDADGVAPAIYSVFREHLMRDLMAPILGPLSSEAFAGAPRGAVTHMTRLRARLTELIRADDSTLLPDGASWPAMLERALTGAVSELTDLLGPDTTAWRWGAIHTTQPRHTLSSAFPESASLLDPPSVEMGGDGDTVQAGSFISGRPQEGPSGRPQEGPSGAGYGLTSTSVARYVFDLGDWERSAWVVPLGSSGHPGSEHYADQVEAWSRLTLLPMRYDWARIAREAAAHQSLD